VRAGRVLAVAALVVLALSLAGCGRKGATQPPEGEESRYTFPQQYADPATQVPTRIEPERVDPDGLEKAKDPSPLWFLK